MKSGQDQIIKVGLPILVLLIAISFALPPQNSITGFAVYGADFVEYDPMNPDHLANLKGFIDSKLDGYEPYSPDTHHLTFACTRSDGKVIVESLNVQIHTKEGIFDQARRRCTGRIYWRGAHK